jgi:hypothetical protein
MNMTPTKISIKSWKGITQNTCRQVFICLLVYTVLCSLVFGLGAVVDLQLPMESVAITTKVVSSNSAHGKYTRYNIMWYVR